MIKILVVDDEEDVKHLFLQRFRTELKNKEFYFHFAPNGEEALNYVQTLDPFDLVLVLSDINMPGMTGLELLKKIRQAKPTLKVMMVSAYSDVHNRNTAIDYGATDFINKPIDFNLLRAKIWECNSLLN